MYTHKIHDHSRQLIPPPSVLPDPQHPNYQKGEYQVILQLTSVLNQGLALKQQVDDVSETVHYLNTNRLLTNALKYRI